eukprot:TRINITY_DN15567_c0_g1_i1.p1 TRINITY_DN15567_c0_g1~~TRINITY_DN15567_c0_g1_i1.p1  ORF type:complete len:827 (+),score=119.94 TRINITY_DN15567_c0_g1_i1:125-2605(+)
MIRRPPRSTLSSSSAASDVYKRQEYGKKKKKPMADGGRVTLMLEVFTRTQFEVLRITRWVALGLAILLAALLHNVPEEDITSQTGFPTGNVRSTRQFGRASAGVAFVGLSFVLLGSCLTIWSWVRVYRSGDKCLPQQIWTTVMQVTAAFAWSREFAALIKSGFSSRTFLSHLEEKDGLRVVVASTRSLVCAIVIGYVVLQHSVRLAPLGSDFRYPVRVYWTAFLFFVLAFGYFLAVSLVCSSWYTPGISSAPVFFFLSHSSLSYEAGLALAGSLVCLLCWLVVTVQGFLYQHAGFQSSFSGLVTGPTPLRNDLPRVEEPMYELMERATCATSSMSQTSDRYDLYRLQYIMYHNWAKHASFWAKSFILFEIVSLSLAQSVYLDHQNLFSIPPPTEAGSKLLFTIWIFVESVSMLSSGLQCANNPVPDASYKETEPFDSETSHWWHQAGSQLQLQRMVCALTATMIASLPSLPCPTSYITEEDQYMFHFDSFLERIHQILDTLCRQSAWWRAHVDLSNPDTLQVFYEPESETLAFGLDLKDRIIVGFRGTKTYKNAVTNTKVCGVEPPQVFTEIERHSDVGDEASPTRSFVHGGFRIAFQSIWTREGNRPGLRAWLVDRLQGERQPAVMCVGHSLGGALATLGVDAIRHLADDPSLSWLLSQRQNARHPERCDTKLSLWTFGSPRVGNHAFARSLQRNVKDMWRVVVQGDPVTNLPMKWLCTRVGKSFYKHVGVHVQLSFDGDLLLNPQYAEQEFFGRWQGWGLGLGPCLGIREHYTSSYWKALRLWITNHSSSPEVLGFDLLGKPIVDLVNLHAKESLSESEPTRPY